MLVHYSYNIDGNFTEYTCYVSSICGFQAEKLVEMLFNGYHNIDGNLTLYT